MFLQYSATPNSKFYTFTLKFKKVSKINKKNATIALVGKYQIYVSFQFIKGNFRLALVKQIQKFQTF